MIAKREIQHTRIYQEFNDTDREYWFDFKKNKFLHNIDTFYYSVKLLEDFTDDSKDDSVLKLRQFFDKKKSLLASRHGESVPVYFSGCDRSLNLRSGTFAGFFNICLENPEKFFSPENFYKMRVDRFKDALMHTAKVGSEGYEIDYVSMGKRSDKVFIRIYLKSKEVIEKNYKPWFFKVWLFNGLINRYDLYCYEECYKKHSWEYLDTARLKYYSEYGTDQKLQKQCRAVVEGQVTMSPDMLHKLADALTPKVNLIMNVEYQTMRKHSKTYQLVPFRDNSSKLTAQRIYDYLDNRKIIADYLTQYVFRMVKPDGDVNKSRRDLCAFWSALRSCRMVDVNVRTKDVKLIRQYCRKLNSEIMKKRVINAAITLGIYTRGINQDTVVQDCVEALCQLNDNDIHDAFRYKKKKARQFNASELAETYVSNDTHEYQVVNINTGELLTDIIP
ncbi:Uncharacterised protein [Blautia obeum]|uniref:Uncharacterized protein n=1 Tax=Blautia obeum TaxID=40520 RepID=A0A174HJ60_9FIRM|nr:hypothetical protein [Blautia obeum]CUO73367.1 Uncharacterised protein [Blautia obeum]